MSFLSTTDFIDSVLGYWYVLESITYVIEKLKPSFITSDERPIKHSIHSLMISNSRNLQKTLGTKQAGSNTCPQWHPGLHPSAVQRFLKSQVMFLQLKI